MSEIYSGGCQCGAVRYELLQRPVNSHVCHCRMCQKQFGSIFAILASVPVTQFRVTRGQMAHFKSSAEIQRGFCRDCGTPLTYEAHVRDSLSVAISTLDRHSEFKPEAQYGIEAREAWFDKLHTLPAFITGEDATGDAFTQLLPEISATNHQHPDHDTQIWPLNHKKDEPHVKN